MSNARAQERPDSEATMKTKRFDRAHLLSLALAIGHYQRQLQRVLGEGGCYPHEVAHFSAELKRACREWREICGAPNE